MNYPVEILPNALYKLIDCDISEYFLLRLTNTKEKDKIWDAQLEQINVQQICSPKERIDDLSLSLLSIYTPAHIFLDFTLAGKEKYMHYCEPNEIVEIPVFETDFLNNEEKGFWCIRINEISQVLFEYQRDNLPFKAKCLVNHTPMMWNYWHFSIRWITDLGPLENLDEKTRKKVAQKIGHAVRVEFSRIATISLPEYKVIPTTCYSNQIA